MIKSQTSADDFANQAVIARKKIKHAAIIAAQHNWWSRHISTEVGLFMAGFTSKDVAEMKADEAATRAAQQGMLTPTTQVSQQLQAVYLRGSQFFTQLTFRTTPPSLSKQMKTKYQATQRKNLPR